jgi:hypothetical protein
VIERGHEHTLRPIGVQQLPDGREIVSSQCICSLEQQSVVRDGRVIGLKFRFCGLWFSPLDLLRVGSDLGVEECPDCGGEAGLVPCERCGDLGVTGQDGEPLAAPELRVNG